MTIDWKKVITGLVTGLVTVLAAFGVVVSEPIKEIIIVVGTAIMLLLPSIWPKKK